MSRFRNVETGVVFSVDDAKDHRYAGELYGSPEEDSTEAAPVKRGPGRPRKSE